MRLLDAHPVTAAYAAVIIAGTWLAWLIQTLT